MVLRNCCAARRKTAGFVLRLTGRAWTAVYGFCILVFVLGCVTRVARGGGRRRRLGRAGALGLVLLLGCNVYDPELLTRREQILLSDAGEMSPDGPSGSDGGPTPGSGPKPDPDAPAPIDQPAEMCQDGCSLAHAKSECEEGSCVITACEDPFLDCDERPDTGCEVDPQSDVHHCGDCDTDCAALSATAEARCVDGSACEIVTCEPGFASCDDDHATGCETSVHSLDNCGGCASRSENEPCSGLPEVMTSACDLGTCEIGTCASGWANCDGRVDNGCEHDVNSLGPCKPSLKRLEIDPAFVDAPLSDFPVLVRLSADKDLMTARSDGGDIFFSSDGGPAHGASALSFEIEAFIRATGDLVAWVRLPNVSDSEVTVFYLRYGDGIDYSADGGQGDVWDGEFESVHHFSAGLGESTGHAIMASNQGSTPDAAGQIAGARAFGANGFVSMSPGVLPDSDTYTVSAWVKTTLAGGDAMKNIMDTSATGAPYVGMPLGVQQNTGAMMAYIDGGFRTSTRDFVTNSAWHLIAARYKIASAGGTYETSVDGRPFAVVYTGNTEDVRTLPTCPFEVGRWAGGTYHFDGSIDELRISSTARSDAWQRANYENQRSGSTFVKVVEVSPP